jgi:hypothetical protein
MVFRFVLPTKNSQKCSTKDNIVETNDVFEESPKPGFPTGTKELSIYPPQIPHNGVPEDTEKYAIFSINHRSISCCFDPQLYHPSHLYQSPSKDP